MHPSSIIVGNTRKEIFGASDESVFTDQVWLGRLGEHRDNLVLSRYEWVGVLRVFAAGQVQESSLQVFVRRPDALANALVRALASTEGDFCVFETPNYRGSIVYQLGNTFPVTIQWYSMPAEAQGFEFNLTLEQAQQMLEFLETCPASVRPVRAGYEVPWVKACELVEDFALRSMTSEDDINHNVAFRLLNVQMDVVEELLVPERKVEKSANLVWTMDARN